MIVRGDGGMLIILDNNNATTMNPEVNEALPARERVAKRPLPEFLEGRHCQHCDTNDATCELAVSDPQSSTTQITGIACEDSTCQEAIAQRVLHTEALRRGSS